MHRPRPVVVWILINAPADASLLQYVRNSWPCESASLVGIAWLGHFAFDPTPQINGLGVGIGTIEASCPFLGVAYRTRPKHNPVGIGARGYGTVIRITDGEIFSHRILERDFFTWIVGHGIRCFEQRPKPIFKIGRASCRERVCQYV